MRTCFRPLLLDFFLLVAFAALATAGILAHAHYGWILLVVVMTGFLHYLLNFRLHPPSAFASLFILPTTVLATFAIAFGLGVPHPPSFQFWMTTYPPGFQLPHLTTVAERSFHASLFSMWAILYGVPVILICQMHLKWYDLCVGKRGEQCDETKSPSLSSFTS